MRRRLRQPKSPIVQICMVLAKFFLRLPLVVFKVARKRHRSDWWRDGP